MTTNEEIEHFISLNADTEKSSIWHANGYFGSTPTEAVARLWLALHLNLSGDV